MDGGDGHDPASGEIGSDRLVRARGGDLPYADDGEPDEVFGGPGGAVMGWCPGGHAAVPGAPPILRPMTVKPILTLGDPRLRLVGEPVDSFGTYLHELLDDLAHTMRDAPGVGLAAPQIGVALQACVIEVEGQLHELVNPRIVRDSGEERDLEGCLSIPGYVAYVTRKEKVWVEAQNRHGRRIKSVGSGLLARAMQHELDHLAGKLYIDYLDSLNDLIPVNRLEDEVADESGREMPALA